MNPLSVLSAVSALASKVFPDPPADRDPAVTDDGAFKATPRLGFANGRLCQWFQGTAPEHVSHWREVPSVEVVGELKTDSDHGSEVKT